MTRVLALAEHRRGRLREVSLEVVSAARSLKDASITIAVLGSEIGEIAERLATFAPRVVAVDDPRLTHHGPATITAVLAELIAGEPYDVIMMPHSYRGMDIAGRLAAALDRGLVSDATGLALDNGSLRATRLMFGGRIEARVALPAGLPQVVSLRPTAFPRAEPLDARGEVVDVAPAQAGAVRDVRFVEYLEQVTADVDIAQADIIVAVGRGIGEQENLELAERLSEALGGVVACSRPLVDRGWLPRSRQVGTSGKTVRPKLYLALGISGAFQHVAGMQGAGRIIAINRDPHAPIFGVADFGIVGDLHEVVPALIDAARARRQQ